MALDAPLIPQVQDGGAAEATNAQLLNRQLSAVIEALGDGSDTSVALITDIAAAITSSIVGGTTGVTANRLLRSKGTSGFALQNSVITCSDTGTLSDVERLLVGLSAVITLAGVDPLVEVAGSTAALAAARYSNNVNPAQLILAKSRSASIGTNTIVQSGDELGLIAFLGASGTTYDLGASIAAVVDGTPGATADMPTRIECRTSPDGSATPVVRWTTKADGSSRFSYQAGFECATLTDASTITWDGLTQQSAKVTLGGNRTLGAPTNVRDGYTYIVRVSQDGTGNRTLAYNAVFKWPGGVAPILSTAANALDILTFVSDGTNMYGVAQKSFA